MALVTSTLLAAIAILLGLVLVFYGIGGSDRFRKKGKK